MNWRDWLYLSPPERQLVGRVLSYLVVAVAAFALGRWTGLR